MKAAAILFKKIVIIGVGVIGGSLGMAACSRGLAEKVVGVDIDDGNLKLALESHAVDEITTGLENAVTDADLVVIATPVKIVEEIMNRIAPFLKDGCIVTDVCSTKAEVMRLAGEILPSHTKFVGGHPMTGSEMFGVKGADEYLFENAVYVLTPTEETDINALKKIKEFISALGGKVAEVGPDEHDLMVAVVSHLPHLTAASLVNAAGSLEIEHEGLFMLAAGGFRDTTRVASGHPGMWKDICLSNKDNIVMALDRLTEVLGRVREYIKSSDKNRLEKELMMARKLRANIPSKLRGFHEPVFEVVATIPDKPGSIAKLASILADEGININEIEILRVREGEGGSVRVAVSTSQEQEKAVSVLCSEGIHTRKR